MKFLNSSILNKIIAVLVPFTIFFGVSLGYLGYKTLVSSQKIAIKLTAEDGLTALSYAFKNFIKDVLSDTRNLANTKEFIKISPDTYESIIEKHIESHENYKFDLSYLIYHNPKAKKLELISMGHDFLYSPEGAELDPFVQQIVDDLSKNGSLDLRESSREWYLTSLQSSHINSQFDEGYEWLKKEPNKLRPVIFSANELAGHHGFVLTAIILKDNLDFINFAKKIGNVKDNNSNYFVIKDISKNADILTIGNRPTEQTSFYQDNFSNPEWEQQSIAFNIFKDLSDFENSKNIILLEVSGAVLFFCIVLWLLIYFLISAITNPLKDLKLFSQALGEGKLETQMPKLPGNEIGSLGISFDMMRYSLHEKINIINKDKLKLEKQTDELKEKTKKLQMILENINQGIFSIGNEKLIENEYSPFTEKILSTHGVSGELYNTVLLDQCVLKSDEKSRIESAIDSILGEHIYTYELNNDHLPNRLELKNGNTIHINIIPIVFENKQVDKLLFSIRDLSDIINVQKQFEEKQKEITIISELVNLDPEEFKRFNENYNGELNNAIKLVSEFSSKLDVLVLEKIFRLLHTLKGQARSYNLSNIADICHESESQLAEFKENTELGIDFVVSLIQEVVTEIEKYEEVFNDKLSERNSTGGDKQKIEFIKQLMLEQTKSPPELIADIKSFLEGKGIILNQLLHPLIIMVERVALELKKPVPIFKVNGGSQLLNSSISNNITFALVHIFRNCLDHSIEAPEERQSKNKPTFGTINIDLFLRDNTWVLSINDDGKGLDIYSIYNKAIAQDLIDSNDKIDQQIISDIILKSGFSTRDKVTDVSGRGVGMDAVNDEIKKINGELKLVFNEQIPQIPSEESRYASFNLEISIPMDKINIAA